MTIVSSLKLLKINRTPAFYIHQYGNQTLVRIKSTSNMEERNINYNGETLIPPTLENFSLYACSLRTRMQPEGERHCKISLSFQVCEQKMGMNNPFLPYIRGHP